jgi:hypothetical protein
MFRPGIKKGGNDMNGLELTFRGKTTGIAADDNLLVGFSIERMDDKIIFNFGGTTDGKTSIHHTWDYAEDVKPGDVFIIKRKEIEKNSEPVHSSEPFGHCEKDPYEGLTTEERAELFQRKLYRFRELESKLKEKGINL